jgi:hypothetical protein
MKVPRYIKKWTHEGPKVLKKYMMSTWRLIKKEKREKIMIVISQNISSWERSLISRSIV